MESFGRWLKFILSDIAVSALAGALACLPYTLIAIWGEILTTYHPVNAVAYAWVFGATAAFTFLWCIGNELSEGNTF